MVTVLDTICGCGHNYASSIRIICYVVPTFSADTQAKKCTDCPTGQYSVGFQSLSCTKCPEDRSVWSACQLGICVQMSCVAHSYT